jgi:mannose-6-phosphate isomerase-like protein (cupin superfamily)
MRLAAPRALSVVRLGLVFEIIMETVDLNDAFSRIHELWSPVTLAKLNGQAVRIAKVKGEFVWHQHENEDELFLVIVGRLTIRFRDREVHLEQGQLFIVPRGVEHQTIAREETQILMFEPLATKHRGD